MGPYDGGGAFTDPPTHQLDPSKRDRSIFVTLRGQTDLSEAAWEQHTREALERATARTR
jgi:hypothetical protein